MTNPVIIDAPEGTPFMTMSREFNAPVAAVFAAHLDPEIVRQWLGPDGYDMDIEVYDVRTGGRYSYTHRTPHGDFSFNGVFHAVRENEIIIQTFEFGGEPDVVHIERQRFIDLGDGRTRLEVDGAFPSQEARDGMIENGMEHGVTEGYARLDTILAS
jgi:uncharacterized protein YndB with AHSA1/START domain